MNEFLKTLLPLLNRMSHLTREDIWSGEAVYRPSVRKAFAEHPRLGFVGNAYSPGGWVLVGANGNSTEGGEPVATEAKYASQDRKHVDLMRTFQQTGSLDALAKLNAFEGHDINSWHMDWVIKGSLERLNLKLEDVVVCNVIPFSTKDAPGSRSSTWANSVSLYFEPFMSLLEPGGVIWMGKAAYQKSLRHLKNRPARMEAVVTRQRNLSMQQRFAGLTNTLERMR